MVRLTGNQIVRLHRQTVLRVYSPRKLLERMLKYLNGVVRPNLPFKPGMVQQICVRHPQRIPRESAGLHQL
jgi:hypothetical protein